MKKAVGLILLNFMAIARGAMDLQQMGSKNRLLDKPTTLTYNGPSRCCCWGTGVTRYFENDTYKAFFYLRFCRRGPIMRTCCKNCSVSQQEAKKLWHVLDFRSYTLNQRRIDRSSQPSVQTMV